MLIVTGQGQGEVQVTVAATAASGAVGTVDYRVVARNAWDGAITRCVVTPADDEGTDVEIDLWVRANIDLANVVIRRYIGDTEMGSRPVGNLAKGRQFRSFLSGWLLDAPTGTECRMDLGYEIVG